MFLSASGQRGRGGYRGRPTTTQSFWQQPSQPQATTPTESTLTPNVPQLVCQTHVRLAGLLANKKVSNDCSEKPRQRATSSCLRRLSSVEASGHFQLSPQPSDRSQQSQSIYETDFSTLEPQTRRIQATYDEIEHLSVPLPHRLERQSVENGSHVSNSRSSLAKTMGVEEHCCETAGCAIVCINICGLRFDIRIAQLNAHPTTLLGNAKQRLAHWDETQHEFFFDRYRPAFEAIFEYYQNGGKLRRPRNVPEDIFLDEVEFFLIEKAAVDEYLLNEGYVEPEEDILPENPRQRAIWIVLEQPFSGKVAFGVGIFSVCMTIFSIVALCAETLPAFRNHEIHGALGLLYLLDGAGCEKIIWDLDFIVDSICTAWFTFEYLLRLAVAPYTTWDFVTDFRNLVDVASFAPFYVTIMQLLYAKDCESIKSNAFLSFFRVFRLVRIFRLAKHSEGLRILLLTFKASFSGLCLFLVALFVCMLLFSSTIYYAEVGSHGATIDSIPDAFWWSIITMCTVGYGDEVPVSLMGRLVGSVCAIAGVLTLAIAVPIITENFNKFYSHKSSAKMFNRPQNNNKPEN